MHRYRKNVYEPSGAGETDRFAGPEKAGEKPASDSDLSLNRKPNCRSLVPPNFTDQKRLVHSESE
ncbi:MAG: hypothetical protein CMJ91_02145 [Planctomycetes bacterium]|nr:hypothetical protein [Planctomycetota bacterium]MBL05281.1 hypothetical protein [Planctomycetota bacterium]